MKVRPNARVEGLDQRRAVKPVPLQYVSNREGLADPQGLDLEEAPIPVALLGPRSGPARGGRQTI